MRLRCLAAQVQQLKTLELAKGDECFELHDERYTLIATGTQVKLPSVIAPPVRPKIEHDGQPWQGRDDFLAGAKPKACMSYTWARPLPKYALPQRFCKLEVASAQGASGHAYTRIMQRKCKGLLVSNYGQPPWTVQASRYRRFFHDLLFIEELQLRSDMSCYDLVIQTPLRKVGKRMFELVVPDLAERRPSVMKGDAVYIRNGSRWKSYVHAVLLDRIWVSLHANFRNIPPFDVQFGLNRTGLRAMHRAVEICDLNMLYLACGAGPSIPEEDLAETTAAEGGKPTQDSNEGGWLSRGVSGLLWLLAGKDKHNENVTSPSMPATHGSSTNLSLNSEQNAFVQAAAADCSTGVQSTLLVWGPPGTGKTTSLAHSIVAILRGPCEEGAEGDTCVLAATPSNAAADVLCSALARLGVSKTEMLRFNAQTRNVLEIPEVLVPFCNELEQIPADFDLANARTGASRCMAAQARSHFKTPDLTQLRSFRVVVCTCSTSSYIVSRLVFSQSGWFSHVFVDEAAEALEPEALMALCSLRPKANGSALAVLAGDFKQLGPIVRSQVAREAGLNVSLLDRLAAAVEVGTPGVFGVQLVETYRSHPSILRLYNDTCYAGQLRPSSSEISRDLESWPGCMQDSNGCRHPVVFHHLEGRQAQDKDSPSWYNLDEAEVVKAYVMSLLSMEVASSDIGVLAPYRKQCQKIRDLLRNDAPDAEVGTPEAFQGREKRVIIVSTVRSSTRDAQQFGIGFVAAERRVNVVLSRAQSLLIVVGNLHALEMDDTWHSVVNLARSMGAVLHDHCKVAGGASKTNKEEVACTEAHSCDLDKLSDSWVSDMDVDIGNLSSSLVFVDAATSPEHSVVLKESDDHYDKAGSGSHGSRRSADRARRRRRRRRHADEAVDLGDFKMPQSVASESSVSDNDSSCKSGSHVSSMVCVDSATPQQSPTENSQRDNKVQARPSAEGSEIGSDWSEMTHVSSVSSAWEVVGQRH